MRLASFETSRGSHGWGALSGGWVVDLVTADRARTTRGTGSGEPLPTNLVGLLEGGPALMERAGTVLAELEDSAMGGKPEFAVNAADVSWRTPLSGVRMFSMRGNNPILLRLDGLSIPSHPTLTPRHPARMIGHRQPIVLRPHDGVVAWGAEFVAVIGRRVKDIDAADARSVIAGYMATNDLSGSCFSSIAPDLPPEDFDYRDEHFAGKFYGTWSMPQAVGPWLVTADEVPDPYHLTVRAFESAVPCDTVTTAAMLFGFEDLISFLSRFMTLHPGDLISSGALGYHVIPGRDTYAAGSWFAIDIENVGRLVNPIVDQRQAGVA